MITIDINCDLGEGNNSTDSRRDALLMPYLSSCNIACGGHAGDSESMQTAIKDARQHQLKIGAHPGYPDKEHFGRRSLELPDNQLFDSLGIQLDSIIEVAAKQDTELHHLKFHGALYNDLEKNPELCQKIADFIAKEYCHLAVYGLAGGLFQSACHQRQLRFVAEGFIDRGYQASGQLTPRSQPNAVFTDSKQCAAQAITLARGEPLQTSDGHWLELTVDTLCLHGDNRQALAIAKTLYQMLTREGIGLNRERWRSFDRLRNRSL